MRSLIAMLVAAAALGGCRGEPSKLPPVHLNPNMDTQDKYKAYGASHLFQDGRTMREPPANTVQFGLSKESDEIYRGQDEFGNFISKFPVTLDAKLMKRGQERYDIFCAPCHDKSGGGKGMVAQRPGLVPPPSFVDSTDVNGRRIINMPVGEIFNTITNGKNTMPAYRTQIPTDDRWAIIAYLRALQRGQNARLSDVPADQQGSLK
jgi:mono/diheme cytochrome c family protein